MQKNYKIWLELMIVVLWGVELDMLFYVVCVFVCLQCVLRNGFVSDVCFFVGIEFKYFILLVVGIFYCWYEIQLLLECEFMFYDFQIGF